MAEGFRPGYQYGFEAGRHHMGRSWDEVESDLKTGWDKFENRGRSRMSEASSDRFSPTGRNR